jgi:hypothetical protein
MYAVPQCAARIALHHTPSPSLKRSERPDAVRRNGPIRFTSLYKPVGPFGALRYIGNGSEARHKPVQRTPHRFPYAIQPAKRSVWHTVQSLERERKALHPASARKALHRASDGLGKVPYRALQRSRKASQSDAMRESCNGHTAYVSFTGCARMLAYIRIPGTHPIRRAGALCIHRSFVHAALPACCV